MHIAPDIARRFDERGRSVPERLGYYAWSVFGERGDRIGEKRFKLTLPSHSTQPRRAA